MHHLHRLTRDDEQPDWFTVTSEHAERLDAVTVGHGALQHLVPHLQLDLLQVVGHGIAGSRPLRVHVHHRENSLTTVKMLASVGSYRMVLAYNSEMLK